MTSESDSGSAEKPKESRKMTRRQFITGTVGGVVIGAAVGAAAGSLGFPTIPSKYQPWLPSKWDDTADVVILGDGFAGLLAAISAHDAGANVLILEKLDQGHEGGSSKVTGGGIWAPTSATQGAAYITANEVGQLTDTTIINALSQGLVDNVNLVTGLGGTLVPLETTPTGTIYVMSINGKNALGGGLLYGFFRDAVSSRSINVMYSTPATDLIQNGDTGEILGVVATTSSGSTINIKANKAVVLATGAFDFNTYMQSQFLVGYPVLGWGGIGNTGDGIQMAQKVGADLWHMSHPASVSAGAAIMVSQYPYPVGSPLGYGIGNNYIWVDRLGNRFVNEALGSASFEYMMQFDAVNGVFSRIPTWVIFDDTARQKGPFVPPGLVFDWFLTYSGYTWSSDNSAEIAAGWITQADSIADLAASIASDSDDQNSQGQPMMTAAALEATIATFNGYVAAGNDQAFGRPSASMAAIQTAPFYAIKTWPSMECAKGGPRRNENCQVVDPSNNPIPRLYSAGMCGSFWGSLGIGGGNIAECLWTGNVAGKNAAALASWS